jgi:hypothetical protein
VVIFYIFELCVSAHSLNLPCTHVTAQAPGMYINSFHLSIDCANRDPKKIVPLYRKQLLATGQRGWLQRVDGREGAAWGKGGAIFSGRQLKKLKAGEGVAGRVQICLTLADCV